MHVAVIVLLLLFVVALSPVLARGLRLPVPLLQIALGVGASLLGVRISFEPDVFMLLFVPPLLFSDAYLMPIREFRSLGRVILTLALGLVLFTTLACGWFVHWLIPQIPLAACFALAAVLSPTDAVAVGGMIEGRAVPHRFLHVLSGEALLNDATGLVCFRFAVAAATTGSFSVPAAVGAFALICLIGLGVGVALAACLIAIERLLAHRGAGGAATAATLSAVLPFAAYLGAERLGASGILAAVAAGLTLRRLRGVDGVDGQTRLVTSAVWSVLTFTFNGLIFLLLGLQLPNLIRGGQRLVVQSHIGHWEPLVAVGLITLVLVALRLVWVELTLAMQRGYRRLRRSPAGMTRSPRLIGAMAVAGVRGAITLAAVLSLAPDFPQRDLLVTLAAGVIVASLLLAALALPALLRGLSMPDVDPMRREADRARLQIARVAIEAAQRELSLPDGDGPQRRAERDAVLEGLLSRYRQREQRLSAALDGDGAALPGDERLPTLRRDRLELAFRLHVLRVERAALVEMTRSAAINDQTERLLLRELDYEEEVLSARARSLPRLPEAVR